MSETLRCFLAIEVSEEVRAVLAGLRRQLEEMSLSGLRYVRPEGVHLTLKFLGEVSEDVAEAVAAEVGPVAAEAPTMSLQLAELGVFPASGPARVLWVGVCGDVALLEELWLGIEASVGKLGFPMEERGFTPHLTLARARNGASSPERRRVLQGLDSLRYAPGLPFGAVAVSLMSSALGPGGAVYREVARLPLGGSQTPDEPLPE